MCELFVLGEGIQICKSVGDFLIQIKALNKKPAHVHKKCYQKTCHRENGGTLGMVPFIINPTYRNWGVGTMVRVR